MHVRTSRAVALVVVLSGLAGCSGGAVEIGSATFSCAGANPQAICLQNCNLGCSATGCQRTDIAQNEIIVLQFSSDLDPATVSSSSIRFRTASGEQPVGEFFVNGNQVEFVPTLLISGGQTFFGFAAGETYTMTIPGGTQEPAVVKSTSGKPFEKTLTCTLNSTRGIVDLNGVPPKATMISPSTLQLGSAPLDLRIVLEFNEMVDATPFLSGTASPVSFSVRRTRETLAPNDGDARECDPASAPVALAGTQRLDFDAARSISVLTFTPSTNLPGNVCIEVSVGNGVTDLSGRPAQPQQFSFLTQRVPVSDVFKTEDFDFAVFLDAEASAGTWAGGTASFAFIGGDQRHGTFDISLGEDLGVVSGKRTYRINTDNTIIPAANTTTGSPIAVTDGRFFFDKMVVPSDVRLRFVGNNPPVFTVAGRLDIQGEIDIAGQSVPAVPAPLPSVGQLGGAAGVFGGAGGQGGDKCLGVGVPLGSRFDGSNGLSGGVLGGHAYAGASSNRGGRGSAMFPATGLNASLLYPPVTTPPTYTIAYTPSATAGGGGGGHWQAGSAGRVVSNNHPDPGLTNVAVTAAGVDYVENASANWIPNRYVGRAITTSPATAGTYTIVANTASRITVSPSWSTVPGAGTFSVPVGPTPNVDAMGPQANGGNAMQLFPYPVQFPIPPGSVSTRSSLHFLNGGGGGGGAGSHACLALNISRIWTVGGGGGGGGGAIALRAGDSLRLSNSAKVLANGGSTPNALGTASGSLPGPGGGGAGGSVVLQSGRLAEVVGLIDVRGGTGGNWNRTGSGSPNVVPNSANVVIAGGAGSPGFVRFEAPGTVTTSMLANMLPAPIAENVATLAEQDDLVSFRSLFYSTGLVFGPEYARYEIHATVDGVPIVYSDDPAISNRPAQVGEALRVLFQAGSIDLASGAVTETRPWRTSVRSPGLASDGLNGYRFMIILDQTVASAANVSIDKVVIVYRV